MVTWWQIPVICYCRPKIIHLDDESCKLRIPLNWRTRNHVQSMYIGVFTVGADLTGGLLTLRSIRKRKRKVVLIFKDFHAKFFKRAEQDVIFICKDGAEIDNAVQQAVDKSERINLPINITAMLSQDTENEPVANFKLTLSIKDRTNA
jgi:hypothetical protein